MRRCDFGNPHAGSHGVRARVRAIPANRRERGRALRQEAARRVSPMARLPPVTPADTTLATMLGRPFAVAQAWLCEGNGHAVARKSPGGGQPRQNAARLMHPDCLDRATHYDARCAACRPSGRTGESTPR